MWSKGFIFWFGVIGILFFFAPTGQAEPIYFQYKTEVFSHDGSDLRAITADDNPNLCIRFMPRVGERYSYPDSMDYFVGLRQDWVNLENSNPVGHIQNAPFSLQIHLTDQASGKSGVLTYLGTLDATFGLYPIPIPSIHPVLGPGFDLITTYSSPLTQSLVLGDNLYRVTVDPNPFGGCGGRSYYLIGGSIDARPINAPEPCSAVLGGFGAAFLGLFSWLRKGKNRLGAGKNRPESGLAGAEL